MEEREDCVQVMWGLGENEDGVVKFGDLECVDRGWCGVNEDV